MARPAARFLVAALAAPFVLVVVALVVYWRQPGPAPRLIPQPNGYDDLRRASRLVDDQTGNFQTLSQAELKALVRTNAEALATARVGLGRDCLVPPPLIEAESLAGLKRLAQAFAAESRLAELEERPADAAHACLETIRLGRQTNRGGLIINSLVSVAIQAIGLARLERLAPTLDARLCREAALQLQMSEAMADSVSQVLAQERAWVWRTYGLKGQFVRLVTWRSIRKTEQTFTTRCNNIQLRSRLLAIQLAARAFELDKGQRPPELAALVPEYLKSVPLDPATGTNLVLRP
jgi:hypothetical protein